MRGPYAKWNDVRLSCITYEYYFFSKKPQHIKAQITHHNSHF